jgi:hypothetical protein
MDASPVLSMLFRKILSDSQPGMNKEMTDVFDGKFFNQPLLGILIYPWQTISIPGSNYQHI